MQNRANQLLNVAREQLREMRDSGVMSVSRYESEIERIEEIFEESVHQAYAAARGLIHREGELPYVIVNERAVFADYPQLIEALIDSGQIENYFAAIAI